MNLGNFSLSLSVKDLAKSQEFYEKLGFQKIDGNRDENWVLLDNGTLSIGLYQGHFDKNTLTFDSQNVRSLQKELKAKGLDFEAEADESSEGSCYAFLFDPDGNPIHLAQF